MYIISFSDAPTSALIRSSPLVAKGLTVYIEGMSRDPKDLERLARELAALTPEERMEVLAAAERSRRFPAPPRGWRPKVLSGSTHWDGGPLTREDLYNDDGR